MQRPVAYRNLATHPRFARGLSALAIACAFVISGCGSESFKPSTGYQMPTAPPAPAQAPPAPYDPARFLDGNWLATYKGGPLRVAISLNQMIRGRNYVGTLIDGNKEVAAGQVMWRGTPDPNVPGLVKVKQICADRGSVSGRWVDARLVVPDANHFTEDLANPKDCSGFPVKYTRTGPAPQSSD